MAKTVVYRVRELPAAERGPFLEYLIRSKKSRPTVEGAADQDQDGYFWSDYNWWKMQHVKPTKK